MAADALLQHTYPHPSNQKRRNAWAQLIELRIVNRSFTASTARVIFRKRELRHRPVHGPSKISTLPRVRTLTVPYETYGWQFEDWFEGLQIISPQHLPALTELTVLYPGTIEMISARLRELEEERMSKVPLQVAISHLKVARIGLGVSALTLEPTSQLAHVGTYLRGIRDLSLSGYAFSMIHLLATSLNKLELQLLWIPERSLLAMLEHHSATLEVLVIDTADLGTDETYCKIFDHLLTQCPKLTKLVLKHLNCGKKRSSLPQCYAPKG